jgi:hypothetical protein
MIRKSRYRFSERDHAQIKRQSGTTIRRRVIPLETASARRSPKSNRLRALCGNREVDAGAQAGQLANIVKRIGKGWNAGSAPCRLAAEHHFSGYNRDGQANRGCRSVAPAAKFAFSKGCENSS